jgi:hypothetical protein
MSLGEADAKLVEWVLSRDFLSDAELAEAAGRPGVADAAATIDSLRDAGLIALI